MTPDEAKQLLARAAAFDNRQPSLGAAQAWAAALHDVPLDDDTAAAIARYYGTPPKNPGDRLWIQPHDIRTIRKQIRSERLDNFSYDGNPDETPAEYLTRLRSQIAAVASGHIPPAPMRPAIEGGPHRNLNELLSTVGRNIPNADEDDTAPTPREPRGPLGINCPDCSAPIGRPCRSRLGKRNPHPARRRAAAGEPIRHDTPEEIEARRQASIAYLANLDKEEPTSA